jgi:hypothetical protein
MVAQVDEMSLTDLMMAALASSAFYQRPDNLAPAGWGQVPAPPLGEGVDQHEAAAALVSEAGLDRCWRPRVLVPHLDERG